MSYLDNLTARTGETENQLDEAAHPDPFLMDKPVRVRSLTEKGQAQYEAFRVEHHTRLEKAWAYVEDSLAKSADLPSDIYALRKVGSDLTLTYEKYSKMVMDYTAFLLRNSNTTSQIMLSHTLSINKDRDISVKKARTDIDNKMQEALEKMSHPPSSYRVKELTTSWSTRNTAMSYLDNVTARTGETENQLDEAVHPDPFLMDKPVRVRSLTEKGQAQYEAFRVEHHTRLEKAWAYVEDSLAKSADLPSDIYALRKVGRDLTLTYEKYSKMVMDYTAFLLRNSNTNSQIMLSHTLSINKDRDISVKKARTDIDNKMQEALEKMSHPPSSYRSVHSNAAASSSVLARKHATAEAARTRAEFASKENGLRKQHALIAAEAARRQAELDADLDQLKCEIEAAAAEAEFRAYQEVKDGSEGRSRADRVDLSIPGQDPMERTKQYVSDQVYAKSYAYSPQEPKFHVYDTVPKVWSGQSLDRIAYTPRHYLHTQSPEPRPALSPYAPTFNPGTGSGRPADPAISDLTRFLLKKELLLSRLTAYNDRPETYAIWKAGFRNIMSELQVSSMEELDLLVKWLGPESTKHALSIRASNVSDPDRGLEKIWKRLDERYGSPEMVEAALMEKLANFPKLGNKDTKRLYELPDICAEIESAKQDPKYHSLLAYFDSSSGVRPIVSKLPYNIQEKWTTAALRYKKRSNVSFPPFSYFAEFLCEISTARNDPSFTYMYDAPGTFPAKKERALPASNTRPNISARKTEIDQPKAKESEPDTCKRCPMHKTNHALNECKGFKVKPLLERKQLLKEYGVCYRCCASNRHMSRTCKETIKCSDCGSDKHPTALHVFSATTVPHGGEKTSPGSNDTTLPVTSKCTQVCGEGFAGKSCAKTLLVRVYRDGKPEEARLLYAILDDQSNMSLANTKFFELFNVHGEEAPYTLSSCAGCFETSGRRASGYIVENLDHRSKLELPNLIECNEIPDVREEIPTPEVAQNFCHLKDIAQHIPPLDNDAQIMLLIGRDLPEAHHVHGQHTGPRGTPFAQELCLGWVIVGEACLGNSHRPDFINVIKTHVLRNGCPSIFKPCSNEFNIRENYSIMSSRNGGSSLQSFGQCVSFDRLGDTVFEKRHDDDKIRMSIEDKEFLKIMDDDFHKDPQGNWVAPLPFRSPRPRLPSNRAQALKRAKTAA